MKEIKKKIQGWTLEKDEAGHLQLTSPKGLEIGFTHYDNTMYELVLFQEQKQNSRLVLVGSIKIEQGRERITGSVQYFAEKASDVEFERAVDRFYGEEK